MLNRGKRENTLPGNVKAIHGDRNDRAVLDDAARGHFDAVIDMCCFDPETCKAALNAFAGKTKQFIFCSTVCTYGVKVPPGVFIDERFPQEPISGYGKNKVACEALVFEYGAAKRFAATVIRPSHTYGPGSAMIDNLEGDAASWDRIEHGLPVLVAGDGLGLWVSTHRDDCGKAFAYAVGNPKTYGQAYNASRDEHTTWREYVKQCAAALGKSPKLLFMPADWIWKHDPKRFGLLREITAYHGAYSSEKAKRDMPEYRCEIGLTAGAAETFKDVRRRGTWKKGDGLYEEMVKKALAAGAEAVEA